MRNNTPLKRGFKSLWPLCSTLNSWIGEFMVSCFDVTNRLNICELFFFRKSGELVSNRQRIKGWKKWLKTWANTDQNKTSAWRPLIWIWINSSLFYLEICPFWSRYFAMTWSFQNLQVFARVSPHFTKSWRTTLMGR